MWTRAYICEYDHVDHVYRANQHDLVQEEQVWDWQPRTDPSFDLWLTSWHRHGLSDNNLISFNILMNICCPPRYCSKFANLSLSLDVSGVKFRAYCVILCWMGGTPGPHPPCQSQHPGWPQKIVIRGKTSFIMLLSLMVLQKHKWQKSWWVSYDSLIGIKNWKSTKFCDYLQKIREVVFFCLAWLPWIVFQKIILFCSTWQNNHKMN